MILLLLAVSLTSIAIIGWIGYLSAKRSLNRTIQDQLQGVLITKSTTLKMLLESVHAQVMAMADIKITIEGMRAFRAAHRQLSASALNPEQEEKLVTFYKQEFLPALDKNVDGEPLLEQHLPAGAVERYLQYHYIVENPNPYGRKEAMDKSPTDASAYNRVHTEFHSGFGRAVGIFNFENIMLVDAETLDIVYSYQKTSEFGTNLETGPYANTGLGMKVRAMRNLRNRDDLKVADFEPYRPSLGRPMGFAISPIFDGPQMIGMLVLQLPIDKCNSVLTGNFNWEAEGLGKTGKCYVVGPDGTMRSESRMHHADPEMFYKILHSSGLPKSVADQIERLRTVICTLPVQTKSVEQALLGRSGIATVTDYRGQKVLSAYGPLEMKSLRWAVLAEIDAAEANAPINAFGRRVLTVATGMALAVTVLAMICSHLLIRPLRVLTEGARRLGAGETDVRVDLKSQDEFGALGRVFNDMAQNIEKQTELLESQVRENQELLLSILPASAVAQRKEGDEKASRAFADVSVFFAEIVGMEEFGRKVGESRALSILGDLIDAFDEAAERSGIEKVKTIGAAYLAVCGLSVTRPDHARRMIHFAHDMGRIIGIFNRDYKTDLSLSAGIHSGPVVGGIVGRRKFLYDLWGDTVAIAKTLSAGKQSAIRLTSTVRERLGDEFQFTGPLQQADMKLEVWELQP